jgi:20S proteasome alpha/beta subunit
MVKKVLKSLFPMIHYPFSPDFEKGDSPMTTIVGICCKDGLVIGSDSKATRGPSAREEYLKIWDLESGCFPAVITGAGRTAFFAKYRDMLQDICRDRRSRQPLQNISDFIRVAEGAMQDLSRIYGTERLARLGLFRPTGDEEGRNVPSFADLFPHFTAVVGVYAQRPHLFFVAPDGIAEEQQGYGSQGSGGPYAEYLLPKMYYEGITTEEAALYVVHVIEQVKHVDTHSGGPTQLAIVTKDKTKHWSQPEVEGAVASASKIDLKAAALWRKAARGVARQNHGDPRKKRA